MFTRGCCLDTYYIYKIQRLQEANWHNIKERNWIPLEESQFLIHMRYPKTVFLKRAWLTKRMSAYFHTWPSLKQKKWKRCFVPRARPGLKTWLSLFSDVKSSRFNGKPTPHLQSVFGRRGWATAKRSWILEIGSPKITELFLIERICRRGVPSSLRSFGGCHYLRASLVPKGVKTTPFSLSPGIDPGQKTEAFLSWCLHSYSLLLFEMGKNHKKSSSTCGWIRCANVASVCSASKCRAGSFAAAIAAAYTWKKKKGEIYTVEQ